MIDPMSIVPPHDLDIERAFLACLLQSTDVARVGCGIVSLDDLYGLFHRDVYAVIRRNLRDHGTTPDVPMLLHMLTEKHPDALKVIGALFGLPADPSRVVEYGTVIKRAARLREALSAAGRYLEAIAGDWRNLDPLQALRTRIEAASVDAGGADTLEEGTERYIATVRERVERCKGRAMPGIPSGYRYIDTCTNGWTPGLWCIGGWSTVGKSAILCQLIVAASDAGFRTLTYSLDMPADAFRDRLISKAKRIPDGMLRAGRMDDAMVEVVERAAVDLDARGMLFYDRPMTVEQLEAHAIRHREQYDMLAIDTLQAVNIDGRFASSYDRCCELVGRIKGIAKRLDVPVLLTCQAKDPPDRRECATHSIVRPSLNDLEGARRITQEAAGVLLVWRAAYGQPGSKDDAAELILAKQQRGRTGTQPLRFNEENGLFIQTAECPHGEDRYGD
jgi:replicative DNA helicase